MIFMGGKNARGIRLWKGVCVVGVHHLLSKWKSNIWFTSRRWKKTNGIRFRQKSHSLWASNALLYIKSGWIFLECWNIDMLRIRKAAQFLQISLFQNFNTSSSYKIVKCWILKCKMNQQFSNKNSYYFQAM